MMPFKNLLLLISTFIVVKGVEASHERRVALHTRDRLCTRDEDCRLFLVGPRMDRSPRFLFCCSNCQSLESNELADEGNREECRCVDMGGNSECEHVGPRNRSIAENPMQRLVDYVKRKHAQFELNLKNSRREFNNKLRNAQVNFERDSSKTTSPIDALKPDPTLPAEYEVRPDQLDIRWRKDLRCGSDYPASTGEPAECNPDGKYYCCSPRQWCGKTSHHCDCATCVNYKEKYLVEKALIENPDNKHCCLTPKCTNYRGLLNMTKSGKTCQAWDSDTYHERHSVLKDQEKRKEYGLEENYCRNPTNNKDGVWCYTTDPDTRWEHCEISFCEWS